MTTSITTFEDNVKTRIKNIVAELIPEDKFNDIVSRAVTEFETKDLPALVKSELSAQYKSIITAELSKPEWNDIWTGSSVGVSENVKKLLVDAAPLMLESMMSSFAQQVVSNLRYQATNRNY